MKSPLPGQLARIGSGFDENKVCFIVAVRTIGQETKFCYPSSYVIIHESLKWKTVFQTEIIDE